MYRFSDLSEDLVQELKESVNQLVATFKGIVGDDSPLSLTSRKVICLAFGSEVDRVEKLQERIRRHRQNARTAQESADQLR